MSRQRKLSHPELITHLENKGVTFEKCSKGQAINFIDKNNYYYKVSAFRKNFKDDNKLKNTTAAVTTLAAQTDLLKYKNRNRATMRLTALGSPFYPP